MSYTVNPATAAAVCSGGCECRDERSRSGDAVGGWRTGEGLHFDPRGPRGLRLSPDVHRLSLMVQAQPHLHPAAGCVSPGDCRQHARKAHALEVEGVAQRYELRRQLCRLDARKLGHHQHVALDAGQVR